MGAEGAAEILFRDAPDKAQMIETYRGLIDVYVAAGNAMIDDVIDPRETRPTIIKALAVAEGKKIERPWRRHGVVPV
jgi:acetyl-CoA carboxylase carboxyltransferase component